MLDEMIDISAEIVPRSLLEKQEDSVCTTPVNPFDIVYTYDKEKDLVILHALIHQKAAW